MTFSTLGTIHIASAVMALVMGLSVFPAAKGTLLHRAMGAGYVAAMLVLNITALGLYRLTGQFNMFHVLAFVSLASIAAGLWPLVARRQGYMRAHLARMTGSYMGLWAAAAAEAISRLPTIRPLLNSTDKIFALSIAMIVIFTGVAIVLIRRMKVLYATA